jgi:hypothetical protein
MLFRNCTQDQLEQAARRALVRLVNLRPEGRGFRATLGLLPDESGAPPAPRWRRRSHTGRRVNVVCWHGWTLFLMALFDKVPEAYVRGGRDLAGPTVYRGRRDFLWKFDETGNQNIGSQARPLAYRDACDCDEQEEGMVERLSDDLYRKVDFSRPT